MKIFIAVTAVTKLGGLPFIHIYTAIGRRE